MTGIPISELGDREIPMFRDPHDLYNEQCYFLGESPGGRVYRVVHELRHKLPEGWTVEDRITRKHWALRRILDERDLDEAQRVEEIAAAERRGYVRGLEAARMSVDGALMRIGEEEGEESMKQTAWVEAPLAIQHLLDRAREVE